MTDYSQYENREVAEYLDRRDEVTTLETVLLASGMTRKQLFLDRDPTTTTGETWTKYFTELRRPTVAWSVRLDCGHMSSVRRAPDWTPGDGPTPPTTCHWCEEAFLRRQRDPGPPPPPPPPTNEELEYRVRSAEKAARRAEQRAEAKRQALEDARQRLADGGSAT